MYKNEILFTVFQGTEIVISVAKVTDVIELLIIMYLPVLFTCDYCHGNRLRT